MKSPAFTPLIIEVLASTGAYEKAQLNDDSQILGVLDSLQLVSFLLDVEAALEKHLHVQINLTPEILEERDGPLVTVKHFVKYLELRLGQPQLQ